MSLNLFFLTEFQQKNRLTVMSNKCARFQDKTRAIWSNSRNHE